MGNWKRARDCGVIDDQKVSREFCLFMSGLGYSVDPQSPLYFSVREINWDYVGDAIPAFLTLIMIPLTYK